MCHQGGPFRNTHVYRQIAETLSTLFAPSKPSFTAQRDLSRRLQLRMRAAVRESSDRRWLTVGKDVLGKCWTKGVYEEGKDRRNK